MLQDLWKKAGAVRPSSTPDPAKPKAEDASPVEEEEIEQPLPGEDDSPADQPAKPEEVQPADITKAKDGKKPSPWKLLEQYKQRLTKAESDFLEFKKGALPEAETKAMREKMEAAEKRLAEYEERIRFTDYQSSQEFQETYQKPYEAAWSRALGELRELTITDPGTQEPRPVTSDDLLQLVNMPLGRAREVANQVFGDFADDVMAHRKEIRGLYEKQAQALDEAKKTGVAKQKELQEKISVAQKKLHEDISGEYDRINKEITEDPSYGEYFKPVEGDTEGNTRLQKGYALVDKAFSENPMNPKLSPEERSAIIKRHAAVRNRAAAFGRLVTTNKALQAKLKALESELETYQKQEPGPGEGAPNGGPKPESGSAMSRLSAELRKLAK